MSISEPMFDPNFAAHHPKVARLARGRTISFLACPTPVIVREAGSRIQRESALDPHESRIRHPTEPIAPSGL